LLLAVAVEQRRLARQRKGNLLAVRVVALVEPVALALLAQPE
jgi:hypothetical protein